MASVIHHRFTVEDYESMISQGIIAEDDHVELIGGEIVKKMSVGKLHAAAVKRLNKWFLKRLMDDATIGIQDPVVLSDSEPEPDISILAMRDDFYEASKPTASDVRLLIEVADTSLEYDREVKLPLYAANGIVELWIVNLNASTVEVYRQPHASGYYAIRADYCPGQDVCPLDFPNLLVPIAEILSSEPT